MKTREELEVRVKLIEDIAAKNPSPEFVDAAKRARSHLEEFDNALQASRTSDAERISTEITELAGSVSELAAERRNHQPQSKGQRWWPYVGMGVLALVFLGLAAFVIYYIRYSGTDTLSTIEGTRPLLVIAAILSTITFGGALIVAPLFSSEESFDQRFRRAREIFLVFSGVFGTVIGFYFGAGDSRRAEISVSALLENSNVVAYASGGTPPYQISLTYGPEENVKTVESTTGWGSFEFDKDSDNLIPLAVSATDSKGLKGKILVELNKEDLKEAGWKFAQYEDEGEASTQ